MIYTLNQVKPTIDAKAWIAPSADVIGDVKIGAFSSVWYASVLRGDVAPITIGKNCSIQDGSVIHVDDETPAILGDDVTVGHRAIIHACTIGDGCLIGMGATVLNGAEIGEESIVAAGAVVTPGKKFPPRSMIMGIPAKVVRTLSEEEAQHLHQHARMYVELTEQYKEQNL
ncbi:MAG: gamma carbonic anhydrase family protein [Candidatus Cloacimonetes bacterium]|nr:gamma carbonic anhydrase family protein [Candidatus Cloacimonadota bacterium]